MEDYEQLLERIRVDPLVHAEGPLSSHEISSHSSTIYEPARFIIGLQPSPYFRLWRPMTLDIDLPAKLVPVFPDMPASIASIQPSSPSSSLHENLVFGGLSMLPDITAATLGYNSGDDNDDDNAIKNDDPKHKKTNPGSSSRGKCKKGPKDEAKMRLETTAINAQGPAKQNQQQQHRMYHIPTGRMHMHVLPWSNDRHELVVHLRIHSCDGEVRTTHRLSATLGSVARAADHSAFIASHLEPEECYFAIHVRAVRADAFWCPPPSETEMPYGASISSDSESDGSGESDRAIDNSYESDTSADSGECRQENNVSVEKDGLGLGVAGYGHHELKQTTTGHNSVWRKKLKLAIKKMNKDGDDARRRAKREAKEQQQQEDLSNCVVLIFTAALMLEDDEVLGTPPLVKREIRVLRIDPGRDGWGEPTVYEDMDGLTGVGRLLMRGWEDAQTTLKRVASTTSSLGSDAVDKIVYGERDQWGIAKLGHRLHRVQSFSTSVSETLSEVGSGIEHVVRKLGRSINFSSFKGWLSGDDSGTPAASGPELLNEQEESDGKGEELYYSPTKWESNY